MSLTNSIRKLESYNGALTSIVSRINIPHFPDVDPIINILTVREHSLSAAPKVHYKTILNELNNLIQKVDNTTRSLEDFGS